MLTRFLLAAILAGVLAGVFVTAVQAIRVTPLILKAETFENEGNETKTHSHGNQTDVADHHHAEDASGIEAWAPENGIERTLFTLLTNVLVGVSFSLILSAGILITKSQLSFRSGLVWGLCGFIAFVLAPNFGLSPELPGMDAANLVQRQIWWFVTVVATSAALLIFAFKQQLVWMLAGLVFIVAPHLYGAPLPDSHNSIVPANLAAEFVIATVVTSFLFWLVLGGALGWLVQHRVMNIDGNHASQ
ncbi:MAG: cobalt transporter [Hyphomicrobiales bacterium]|nr:cobalt transporter [Hyphomicrobiales bacterium]